VFTVSGGGIMHLIDSLGREPAMRYICNYHEQACAIAAESYARTRDGLGVCLVTTGPGSVNALSGIAGAWVDSVPVFVVSGQVRRDLIADYRHTRQLGPQEINIDEMAAPVTKYFCTLMDANRVRFELEKALWISRSGRPGPVWINLPLDVQGATVDPSALVGFAVPTERSDEALAKEAATVLGMLQRASRPLLVPGNGIHLSGGAAEFHALVDWLQIPVSPTLGGMDLLGDDHRLNIGRFGPIGQRHANFVVQNADLIIALGASMSVSTVGFNTAAFAPKATTVMVNADKSEIAKARPAPDLQIAADARQFMQCLLRLERPAGNERLAPWLAACREWEREYPRVAADCYRDETHVNSYVFAKALGEFATASDAILTGNSLDAWSIYQSFSVKEGQRVFTNINFGAMGWDLPAAIGACVARGGRRTILVTGDGSIQFNVQELQTIRHNSLDIKVFILNNKGYASIRSTQESHFGGHLVGSDQRSGVSNPSFQALASAYGIGYARIDANDELESVIPAILKEPGAALCEVNIAYDQGRAPRVMSRRREDGSMESGTLENMYPFLPVEEVRRNMERFDGRPDGDAQT